MAKKPMFTLPKGVHVTNIPRHTPEWFKYRQNGIGASELGTVLRQKYWDESGIWGMWSEKIGLKPTSMIMTETMLHGYLQEDYIAELWQMWCNRVDQNGEPLMVKRFMDLEQARNKKTGNKMDYIVRSHQRINGFVTNPDYPFLYVSLDRWAFPDQFKIDFETKTEFGFPVECKNLGEYVARKYISGVPEYYHSQGQSQMAVCRVNYMEFAMLQGGNRFKVEAFEYNRSYMADIIEAVMQFWNHNVLPGREIMHKIEAANAKGENNLAVELFEELQNSYAPQPVADNPEDIMAYYSFLTERALMELTGDGKMHGDLETWHLGLNWKVWEKWKSICDLRAKEYKNAILKKMVDNNVIVIDWGKDFGRLSLVSNGFSRYPKNSMKAELNENLVTMQLPREILDIEKFFD